MLRLRPISKLIFLIALAGCASARHGPPALIVPSVQVTTSYYAGTPLSGPRNVDVAKISFDQAMDVRARWFVLERFDASPVPLLASQARLITARLGGSAVLPSGTLTGDARLLWSDSSLVPVMGFLRNAPIGGSRGALAPGVTVALRAIDGAGSADQTLNSPQPRYMEVSVAQLEDGGKAGKVQVGFTVQDSPSETPESGVFQTETAIVEHSLGAGPLNLLVIVPFKFTATNARAAAVIVSISPHPGDRAFEKIISQARAELASPAPSENSGPAWALGLHRALESLGNLKYRRAALVFLASQSDADICLDVVSVCDDSMLASIAGAVRKDGSAALDDPKLDQFGWIMDRSSIAAMQPLLSRAALPPELFEVLTLHMGEPGRHAAAVDDIMHGASSRKELQDRLVAENFIYLEDSSPAARVRSFDWLKERGLEPAGYDPLASPRQRRLALDKALEAQSGGATP